MLKYSLLQFFPHESGNSNSSRKNSTRESLLGTEAVQRKAHEKLWAQSSYPEDFK